MSQERNSVMNGRIRHREAEQSSRMVGLLEAHSSGGIREASMDRVKNDLEAFWATRRGSEARTRIENLTERGAMLDFVWGIRFRHLIGKFFFYDNDVAGYCRIFPKHREHFHVIKVLSIVSDGNDTCLLKLRMGGHVVHGDMKGGTEFEATISTIRDDDNENARLFDNWKIYRRENREALSAVYSRELRRMGLSEVRA